MNKNIQSLPGLLLELEASEPWEISDEFNRQQVVGEIISVSGEKAVIKLSKVITLMKTAVEYFLISPRYTNQKLLDLLKLEKMTLGFEYTYKDDKFDFYNIGKNYRGNVGFIGIAKNISRNRKI